MPPNSSFIMHIGRRLTLNPSFFQTLRPMWIRYVSLAARLRRDAATLRSLDLELNALKLDEIASDCDDEAWQIDPSRLEPGDDPWIISRRKVILN